MPTTTIPLSALRAQKVAALLALAHQAEVPVPTSWGSNSHEVLEDLNFAANDREMYDAWREWLPSKPTTCGVVLHAELAELGSMRVLMYAPDGDA